MYLQLNSTGRCWVNTVSLQLPYLVINRLALNAMELLTVKFRF